MNLTDEQRALAEKFGVTDEMLEKAVKDPSFKKAQDNLRDITSGYAMIWALGELVRLNRQADARWWIRKLWKAYRRKDSKDPIPGGLQDCAELVLDEFFNRDGDMARSANKIEEELKEKCPEDVWPTFFEGMKSTRDHAFSMIASRSETAKGDKSQS